MKRAIAVLAFLACSGPGVPLAAQPTETTPAPVAEATDTPQPLLRREGDFIVDRPARLVALADGALAAVFEPPAPPPEPQSEAEPLAAAVGVDDEGFLGGPPPPEPVPTLPPMVLQPSRQLDALREVRASGDPDARFLLSGRVQRYRGRNHLLLGGFAGLRPAAEDARGPEAAEPGPPPRAEDGATASVEALMAEMDADAAAPPAAPQRPAPTPTPTPDAGDAAGPGWRDGALVNRRLGRVVPGGGGGSHPGSVFVFDAGDPPLRLLAGAVTERAETLLEDSGDDLLFELSGQVSVSGREAWVLPAALHWRPAAGRVDEPAN